MLNSHSSTFKNLRLLATVNSGNYLSTSSDGDIEEIIDNGFVSSLNSFIWRETWNSNLVALNKLFVKDVPALLSELFKEERIKELIKVEKLLTDSKKGLTNLKSIFDNPSQIANISCFQEDFLATQIEYVNDAIEDFNSDQ